MYKCIMEEYLKSEHCIYYINRDIKIFRSNVYLLHIMVGKGQCVEKPIPYLGLIPEGLQPGKMIIIDGFVPHHSKRFDINIQCSPAPYPKADICFHISVRFLEIRVVRNHLKRKSWGTEDHNGVIPLTVGASFKAVILCEEHCYKLAFNGSPFCEFPHRIAFKKASHITIDGDVMVSFIQIQGGQSIPHLGLTSRGLRPGIMIIIKGLVLHNSTRLDINIQCGPAAYPKADICFHISIRILEMRVVRNHFQDKMWGTEDRIGVMPLKSSFPFVASILCEEHCYKLAFDGSYFCDFPHRIPLQRASNILMNGDAIATVTEFREGLSGTWGAASTPPMSSMGAPPIYEPPPPYNEEDNCSDVSDKHGERFH